MGNNNKATFKEYVTESYTENFLNAYGVKDLNIPQTQYVPGPDDKFGHDKELFDNATKAFAAGKLVNYTNLVALMYDKGVFELGFKQSEYYINSPEKSKEDIFKLHPRTIVSTIMIAELIEDRIKALEKFGIVYNDENKRFIDDKINNDITDFRNSYWKENSCEKYEAILKMNKDIERLSNNPSIAGVKINSTDLQEFLILSKHGKTLLGEDNLADKAEQKKKVNEMAGEQKIEDVTKPAPAPKGRKI